MSARPRLAAKQSRRIPRMSADLIDLVHRLGRPRVLVVGDLMLDRYVWGDAARISQEAPVILLRADRREERLGGASSGATMLPALGADVALACVVGADARRSRGGTTAKPRGGRAPPPTRLEAGLAVGRELRTTTEALATADELCRRLDLEAAVVTLDRDGMALAERSGRREVIPTRPRQVYDIT